ncbi:serine/threonine-protein kinase MRCK alpha-like [Hydractinia symbiolongicarpus]|uniref:serine/threonine-protein kinase MRCK alpha-like n=1 Tax=Hydractinia symbiolongicarpus TaxID=13093 RepID=UPI00254D2476|nr:serine/threonine-protein kinase MRCK alpha-like [Hydractinia symbiolongicarpus]
MEENGAKRLKELEKLYTQIPGIEREVFSVETLLDILLVLYDECNTPLLKRDKHVTDFIDIVKPVATRVKHLRLKRDDFDTLNVIGRGAFGEVAVVQMKSTSQIYAMKTLNKWEMLKRAETACFREERDVLVFGDNRWVTKLHYAFQDESNLYFVMDYYSGGDLLTLLSKYEDHIPEKMLKFYVAEIILAINSIHELNYVHRDIKPDNVLIDVTGHIRLADFGSCLKIGKDGYVKCSVAVGTPDYISPEILQAMEAGKGEYGKECDWWSLGICCYEMIYGETPFYAESLVETYGKIMDHKSKFIFPDDYEVSDHCKDLMSKLVCDSAIRLGRNGIHDFKSHPFFEHLDWENIFDCTPPYVPELDGPTDVSNFDVDDLMEAKSQEFAPPPTHQAFTGHHLPFIGFTFTKDSPIADSSEFPIMRKDETDGGPKKESNADVGVLEKKIITLRKEKSELQKKLEDSLKQKTKNSMNEGSKTGSAELVAARKKVTDLEQSMRAIEKANRDLDIAKKNIVNQRDELTTKVKELERSKRSLTQDREYAEKEVKELKEKLSNTQKDFRETQGQKKLAMEEFSDLNDKLAEVRSQKMKLSRLVREKEEEIENVMNKLDQHRQDLRTSEKKKRELITQVEELQADVHRESKLRAKADLYCQQLEEEIDSVKSKKYSGISEKGQDQEISKLKSEIEKMKTAHEDMLSQEKKKTSVEVKMLKEKVAETEQMNSSLEQEIKTFKEKLDRKSRDVADQENAVFADFKNATLRNKNELQKENNKLSAEIEKLTAQLEKSNENQKRLDDEIRQGAEKRETVSHWEEQITEIIQWVSDEKDARGYLQALATKMSEELEGLKVSGLAGGAGAGKNWQTRRSQRLDKQELLSLQANLKMEMQAKQHLNDELAKLKNQFNQSERRNQESDKQLSKLKSEVIKLQKENEKLKLGGGAGDFSFSFLNFMNSDISLTENLDEVKDEETNIDMPQMNSRADSYSISVSSTPRTTSNAAPSAAESVTPSERDHPVATPAVQLESNHRLMSKNFPAPTKCHNCMSIMIGHTRQGMVCEVCSYHCHMHCVNDAPKSCPVPQQLLTNRPLGIDPKKGTGTAHESFVRIPKPGGVKRGWMRAYAVVCDFKVLLYETSGEKTPTNELIEVIDMKDEGFSVSSVLSSDVIHANKRDVPSIFKISVSGLGQNASPFNQLVLCSNESERHKWVAMLQELVQLFNKTHGADRKNEVQGLEICDNSMQIIRSAASSAIINPEKVVFGTDDGLYAYELTKEIISRIDDVKKVIQVEMIAEEQLLIVLGGKQRHIRLYPLSVVEGHEIEPIKIPESKGALSFATGSIRNGSCTCLCVGQKKSAMLYELNRTKNRYRKIRDVPFNLTCQWLGILRSKLIIGYPSGFVCADIIKEGPMQRLVSPEDSSLKFLASMNIEALLVADVEQDEYLLCFRDFALYVNESGVRTRSKEISWPTPITSLAFNKPYIQAYSDRGIDLFDTVSGLWLQTLQIPKAQPLSRSGVLNFVALVDQQSVIYVKRTDKPDELSVKSNQGKRAVAAIYRLKQTKKRLSFKTRESLKAEEADLMSKLISGPSNFSHVSHMGPGDGLQILQDIPIVDDKLAMSHSQKLRLRQQGGRPVSSYQASPPEELAGMKRSKSMELDGSEPDSQYDHDTVSSSSTASNTSENR